MVPALSLGPMQQEVVMTSRKRMSLTGAAVTCGLAILSGTSSASPFSAELTHRGLVTGQNGTMGMLVPRGLFRRPGDPMFVYKSDGRTIAGVWSYGPDAAIVRSGTSESAPVIGRIVPSWDGDALRISIEPASGPTITTDVFGREGSGPDVPLSRTISSRGQLQGTYRATLRSNGSGKAGWLSVSVDPEGATRFDGDLPPAISPALAAAAVQAIDTEVYSVRQDLTDVYRQ
jgi:hypothetical protein